MTTAICFANVALLEPIPSTPERIFMKLLTHDVYRSAVEHYKEMFWVLVPKKLGTRNYLVLDDFTQCQL